MLLSRSRKRCRPFMNDDGDDQPPKKLQMALIKKILGGDKDGDDKVSRINNHIYFYSKVDSESLCKLNKEIFEAIQELKYVGIDYGIKPPMLYIHIHSYGGELDPTMGTYDIIRNADIPITSIVEGEAASSAALIAVAAKHRHITKHSSMLIHQLSAGMWGTYAEMEDDMENAKLAMEKIKKILLERTSIPSKELDSILDHDLDFDAVKCKKYGLVDKII